MCTGIKGFTPRNLRIIKQVYEKIKDNPIWTQLVSKLQLGQTLIITAKI